MARDKYHKEVREALEKEGWTITHDPYKIMIGRRRGYIDLGAEIIGAEKDDQIIAVESKVSLVFQTLTNLKMHWAIFSVSVCP